MLKAEVMAVEAHQITEMKVAARWRVVLEAKHKLEAKAE